MKLQYITFTVLYMYVGVCVFRKLFVSPIIITEIYSHNRFDENKFEERRALRKPGKNFKKCVGVLKIKCEYPS